MLTSTFISLNKQAPLQQKVPKGFCETEKKTNNLCPAKNDCQEDNPVS